MAKTTYLLGAGASAGDTKSVGIPCIVGLEKEMDKVFSFLLQDDPIELDFSVTKGGHPLVSSEEIRQNWHHLHRYREQLKEELQSNISIDTVAKLYYALEDEKNFLMLKGIMTACFVHWERTQKLDHRYNNFWATLMRVIQHEQPGIDRFRDFYGEISIVSWNYDKQLEQSLERILAKSPSKYHAAIVSKMFDPQTVTNPSVFKLNGTAGIPAEIRYTGIHQDFPGNTYSQWEWKYWLAAIILFPDRLRVTKNLCYSWELETNTGKDVLDLAYHYTSQSETLVVIGYSFPSLNHSVDVRLIEGMPLLKKVYFQGVTKADSLKIMDYFQAVAPNRPIKLIPIEAPGFFIPPEVTIDSLRK